VKYTVSIEIALPREQVVQLLADPHTYRSGCAAWFCTSRWTGCRGRSVPLTEAGPRTTLKRRA